MSMLSAQCDELRAMAESVGLTMPKAATLMMEAADTILSLRDRAQDLQAENAKLRSELESVGTAAYLYGRSDLKVENNRLRELAQRADRLLTDIFPYIDYSRCTALEAVAAWRVGARELGIEVDE